MASILSHALLKMPSRIVCMNQASELFIGPIGFTYWKSSSSSNLQCLIWSTLLIHLMLSYIYTFTYKKGDNWMCQELGSNLVFSMLNAYFNWHGVRSFILQKCRQKMDGRKQNHTDVQAVCMVVQKAFQWLIIWQQITSHTDILLKILVLSNAGEAENTEFVQIHLPPCLHFFSPEGCTHTYTTWVKLNIKRTNDSVIEAKFSRELSGQQWEQTI